MILTLGFVRFLYPAGASARPGHAGGTGGAVGLHFATVLRLAHPPVLVIPLSIADIIFILQESLRAQQTAQVRFTEAGKRSMEKNESFTSQV